MEKQNSNPPVLHEKFEDWVSENEIPNKTDDSKLLSVLKDPHIPITKNPDSPWKKFYKVIDFGAYGVSTSFSEEDALQILKVFHERCRELGLLSLNGETANAFAVVLCSNGKLYASSEKIPETILFVCESKARAAFTLSNSLFSTHSEEDYMFSGNMTVPPFTGLPGGIPLYKESILMAAIGVTSSLFVHEKGIAKRVARTLKYTYRTKADVESSSRNTSMVKNLIPVCGFGEKFKVVECKEKGGVFFIYDPEKKSKRYHHCSHTFTKKEEIKKWALNWKHGMNPCPICESKSLYE